MLINKDESIMTKIKVKKKKKLKSCEILLRKIKKFYKIPKLIEPIRKLEKNQFDFKIKNFESLLKNIKSFTCVPKLITPIEELELNDNYGYFNQNIICENNLVEKNLIENDSLEKNLINDNVENNSIDVNTVKVNLKENYLDEFIDQDSLSSIDENILNSDSEKLDNFLLELDQPKIIDDFDNFNSILNNESYSLKKIKNSLKTSDLESLVSDYSFENEEEDELDDFINEIDNLNKEKLSMPTVFSLMTVQKTNIPKEIIKDDIPTIVKKSKKFAKHETKLDNSSSINTCLIEKVLNKNFNSTEEFHQKKLDSNKKMNEKIRKKKSNLDSKKKVVVNKIDKELIIPKSKIFTLKDEFVNSNLKKLFMSIKSK